MSDAYLSFRGIRRLLVVAPHKLTYKNPDLVHVDFCGVVLVNLSVYSGPVLQFSVGRS